jgi:hypothetical protein
MELGGKGSFQAVKLQRPARATVCSHSTRDMVAICSIVSKQDHEEAQQNCLSVCLQFLEYPEDGLAHMHTPGIGCPGCCLKYV